MWRLSVCGLLLLSSCFSPTGTTPDTATSSSTGSDPSDTATSTTGTSSSSVTSTSLTSTTPATTPASTSAGSECGDGFVDGPEECDSEALNGVTCQSLGFREGTLACTAECSLDTSACTGGGEKYSAVGPQVNVPVAAVVGWQVCYQDTFGTTGQAVSAIVEQCTKAHLMLACREAGAPAYTLLAHAPRDAVLQQTEPVLMPATTEANGTAWYFHEDWSWGFALAGDALTLNRCDGYNTNVDKRLCWPTVLGELRDGFRCGAATGLVDGSWERLVLQAD
ncbi:hypothetical protein OV203_01540 [Nannocystis sp. ILAH1]|uniref:hypothetical protein n=1 Tax=Nannocystis sp. ILAH1 TaxID=2996789 RepID=UPI00226FB9F4|nr:hypothetical protein [Nannocystis sp. ILAH1]MCY0985794.1 hypothetical protein [Nannocystis sp. ILAH1]